MNPKDMAWTLSKDNYVIIAFLHKHMNIIKIVRVRVPKTF